MTNNKNIGNIIIFICWLVLICVIAFSINSWNKSSDSTRIIIAIFWALGLLFNICILSKSKNN